MKKGDIVLISDFKYGKVLNIYRNGLLNTNMVDVQTISGGHPSQIGEHRTFHENNLIVMQEAQNA